MAYNTRLLRKSWPCLLTLAILAVVAANLGTGPALAAISISQPMTGSATYYNDIGYGACGTPVDASVQDLVAVSYQWWTAPNPNDDPLCRGISVQLTYNGNTITVPVEDKCPSCAADHIDLSQQVFQELAPLSQGVINGITWEFVNSGGSGLPVQATTPTSGGSGAPFPAVSPATVSPSPAVIAATVSPSPAVTPTGSSDASSGCAAAWDPGMSYGPGEVVFYSGDNWTATAYSTGATPNDPSSWAAWTNDGPCS
jgi:Lytic transglycolase